MVCHCCPRILWTIPIPDIFFRYYSRQRIGETKQRFGMVWYGMADLLHIIRKSSKISGMMVARRTRNERHTNIESTNVAATRNGSLALWTSAYLVI